MPTKPNNYIFSNGINKKFKALTNGKLKKMDKMVNETETQTSYRETKELRTSYLATLQVARDSCGIIMLLEYCLA